MFFFESRRRNRRSGQVWWARRSVQETGRKRERKGGKESDRGRGEERKAERGKKQRRKNKKKKKRQKKKIGETVSYTHLTLPTICSVQISVVGVSIKKKKEKNTGMFRAEQKHIVGTKGMTKPA
eukprot:TRINITY_DN8501_c1_g1_i1.p2 TRINITY_DN8501_c1_g1~~TRINITY_DN8501_c1_g1_i1.p2  ORF type:complete len:124 (+),score=30.42 TRINITY_DN8501_c1_g1_i1:38-409(+)